jgi:hypothetical protein
MEKSRRRRDLRQQGRENLTTSGVLIFILALVFTWLAFSLLIDYRDRKNLERELSWALQPTDWEVPKILDERETELRRLSAEAMAFRKADLNKERSIETDTSGITSDIGEE